MTFSFSDFSSALRDDSTLSAEAVLELRRAVGPDGAIARAEAKAIFELHRHVRGAGPEWADFFIEAIADHVLNGTEPRAYVDDETAAWLTGQIARSGRPISTLELELVVKILETALNAPTSLKAWALAEVERCVLEGMGATRGDGAVRPGVVDEAEVQLMRRIVFAGGGDGALVVSGEEAEMMWRIKDATLGPQTRPAGRPCSSRRWEII
jgi:hypothetical protein